MSTAQACLRGLACCMAGLRALTGASTPRRSLLAWPCGKCRAPDSACRAAWKASSSSAATGILFDTCDINGVVRTPCWTLLDPGGRSVSKRPSACAPCEACSTAKAVSSAMKCAAVHYNRLCRNAQLNLHAIKDASAWWSPKGKRLPCERQCRPACPDTQSTHSHWKHQKPSQLLNHLRLLTSSLL